MDGLLGWDREVHPSRDDSFFLALHFAFFKPTFPPTAPLTPGFGLRDLEAEAKRLLGRGWNCLSAAI